MLSLLESRRELLGATLTQDQTLELQLKVISKIDWGNRYVLTCCLDKNSNSFSIEYLKFLFYSYVCNLWFIYSIFVWSKFSFNIVLVNVLNSNRKIEKKNRKSWQKHIFIWKKLKKIKICQTRFSLYFVSSFDVNIELSLIRIFWLIDLLLV